MVVIRLYTFWTQRFLRLTLSQSILMRVSKESQISHSAVSFSAGEFSILLILGSPTSITPHQLVSAFSLAFPLFVLWYTGASSYSLMRADLLISFWLHVMPCWQLKINQNGNIYTTEIDRWYKLGVAGAMLLFFCLENQFSAQHWIHGKDLTIPCSSKPQKYRQIPTLLLLLALSPIQHLALFHPLNIPDGSQTTENLNIGVIYQASEVHLEVSSSSGLMKESRQALCHQEGMAHSTAFSRDLLPQTLSSDPQYDSVLYPPTSRGSNSCTSGEFCIYDLSLKIHIYFVLVSCSKLNFSIEF